jgi:hypothetical protein
MKNIDYLELFFKKHKLSGKIKVKYSSNEIDDDYMTDITLENGDVININDIIFDIESEFPDDLFNKWIESKRETGISFIDWLQSDNNYIPKDMDRSSVEKFQKEMTDIFDDVKESINKIFELIPDEGNSDDE